MELIIINLFVLLVHRKKNTVTVQFHLQGKQIAHIYNAAVIRSINIWWFHPDYFLELRSFH